MCLESLHTYRWVPCTQQGLYFQSQLSSLVAFVVKKNGLLTKLQNIVIGWGVGVGITLVVVSLEYKNYGGQYFVSREQLLSTWWYVE